MATTADEPPPKMALRCTNLGHARIAVRENWFYCTACEEQFDEILDFRAKERIAHEEFVARWGLVEYRDYTP